MLEAKERLIFALDVPDRAQAVEYIRLLRGEVGLFKVGLELYLSEGPRLLKELAGVIPLNRIFLDLKLYDIPATVIGALRPLVPGLAMITLPSDQGATGLQKVVAALGAAVKILAVTVLTSMTAEDLLALGYEPRYAQDPTQLVRRKARLAQEAGCHGVICSGREVRAVKAACGPDFLAVCPGIRPGWAKVAADDQNRTVTALEAIQQGADYIVVGRPIRQAPDPVTAARRVVAEIAAARTV
jgi:orotidine-5'-phosphate decarboxylase